MRYAPNFAAISSPEPALRPTRTSVPVEMDRRPPFGVALEAEVDVGGEAVGGRRLGRGVRLVERLTVAPRRRSSRTSPVRATESAVLADTTRQSATVRAVTERLQLTDCGDARPAARLASS